MHEIGGYIELDTYDRPMFHEGAIPLNCGRNCLAYLIKSRGLKKIALPFYCCSSVSGICKREGISVRYYHTDMDFLPSREMSLSDGEWLYLVNFYGQLSNEELGHYVDKFKRVIIDQANAYFREPFPGVDTLYTCRKWFGVADGAFLYTDCLLDEDLPIDESFERMRFLLGRLERNASEFYNEYVANNEYFKDEPIKRMSKLTMNLLHGIDYDVILKKRTENFGMLHELLGNMNKLKPRQAEFMYPFWVEKGDELRKQLQQEKIYIPTLWPSVFDITYPGDIEYEMAKNILPLPIDQRYGERDMEYMAKKIAQFM